jgi:hypothetical protein
VQISKEQLLQVLRTAGDNDIAEKVAADLPDEIDTDRDAEALAAVGLDRTQLMAKLAAGGLGGALAP